MKKFMKELINHVIRIHTNMILRLSMILLLCIGFNSCKSQKTQSVKNNNLNLLVQDSYSGIDNFETLVVRDQKTLNAFYLKLNKIRKPGLSVPKIDFSKDMAVVVCMGQQTGNDLPFLVKTKEDANSIILQVNLNKTAGDMLATVISSPFCIYKIPRTSKEIIFSKD